MRVAIDTNVLIYAEGVNDAERRVAVVDLLRRMPKASLSVSTVALGELYQVLVRKGGRSPSEARRAVLAWCDAMPPFATSPAALMAAVDLAADHQIGVWDAIILAVAAESGCRLLLSEEFQEGFTWSGVTVTSPFTSPHHRLLEALLQQAPG
jgi:predicted nucleic acid-binding protein